MPDKGKVMSQAFYEKQSKLYELIRESFGRKETDVAETITVLKVLGFGNSMAGRRVNEWAMQHINYASETAAAKNRRLKQRDSLEKYVLCMRLGRKYYMHLKSKFKDKELSRDEVMSKLMQAKHSKKLSESIMEKWKNEK